MDATMAMALRTQRDKSLEHAANYIAGLGSRKKAFATTADLSSAIKVLETHMNTINRVNALLRGEA